MKKAAELLAKDNNQIDIEHLRTDNHCHSYEATKQSGYTTE
jgi:hypothetical protein